MSKFREMVKDREAWSAPVRGVTESDTTEQVTEQQQQTKDSTPSRLEHRLVDRKGECLFHLRFSLRSADFSFVSFSWASPLCLFF